MFGLAYLHIVEPGPTDPIGQGARPDGKFFRTRWRGPLMLNKGYDLARANAAIADGTADLISFATLYLANPDLPERAAPRRTVQSARPGDLFRRRRGERLYGLSGPGVGHPEMERFAAPELTARAIMQIAERVAAEVNQSINEETPLLSAAMPHGERFQGVLAPAAADGGAFSIRKQVISDLDLDDYQGFGALENVRASGPRVSPDEDVSDLERELAALLRDTSPDGIKTFLRVAVQNAVTMVVSGGTSSGKTTFLNALLKEVPSTERVMSIEDTRELKPPQPNYLALVASKGDRGRRGFLSRACSRRLSGCGRTDCSWAKSAAPKPIPSFRPSTPAIPVR